MNAKEKLYLRLVIASVAILCVLILVTMVILWLNQ